MKQLSLPFFEDKNLYIYELYSYVVGPLTTSKTYRNSVDFTLARNIAEAEEFFLVQYPEWWKTMAVKKVDSEFLSNKISFLEDQLQTCKFIAKAYSIVE